jgi:heme-degrading monooxygenase HmoA
VKIFTMKFIFQITIKPDHTIEEYVEAWKRASEIIQRSAGARGTRLYRKTSESNVLLAIAEWDSKPARDQAMARLEKTDPATQAILGEHLKFGELTTLGSFDETEWFVLP